MKEKSVPGYIMSSQSVVDESLIAYSKGKYLIINGRLNRFAKFITSILPTSWSLRFSKNIIKKGMDKKSW